MIPSDYLGPFIVTNTVSVALIVLAIVRPRATRTIFVVIFLAAGAFNAYTALSQPEVYLAYGSLAIFGFYRDFIEGFFSRHTEAIILTIALGQLAVGVLLTRHGRLFDLGTFGGVLFLVAIAPLGIGSALPSTLLMAGALIVMWRRLGGVRERPVGK